MKSNDVDADRTPSEDREHSGLTCSVSDDERSILGAVLRNGRYLGSSQTITYGDLGICVIVIMTYGREHPQGFV